MFNFVVDLISRSSYFGVFFLMENIFPPIPSEIIMPFAGFVVSKRELNLVLVLLAGTAGSVAGTLPWYYAGKWLGRVRLERLATKHGRWLTISSKEVGKSVDTFRHHEKNAEMNALRGLLAEYGEVFGTGRKSFDAGMKAALERLAERLPMPLIDTLRDQWNELARLDDRIARIEASLLTWMRQDRAAKAIFAIPGVGLLTATAVVAAMGDAKAFRSGREFALRRQLGQRNRYLQRAGRRWRPGRCQRQPSCERPGERFRACNEHGPRLLLP